MNTENYKVLTNIIGAVETGGQVYGKRRFDAYEPPYNSTPNEHTITLGYSCHYGSEARQLIQMIYDKDPKAFAKIDTNGSIKAMLKKDWVAIRWNPNKEQKNILIKLIDSPIGHECQDELFMSLMKKFVADCEKAYTKNIPAIMMYCEIRHLGGKNPVDRIFKRCNGNYSLDNIMAALKKDQNDTSSSNQVGDKIFWSRHQKCVEFIKKYAVDETKTTTTKKTSTTKKSTTTTTKKITATTTKKTTTTKKASQIDQLLAIAEAEVGYLEKKSNSNLDNKTANAGSNNYTKYARDCFPSYQGLAWCAMFCVWCFNKAFGKEATKKMLGGWSADCDEVAAQYKAMGRWYKSPKVGDQIVFIKNGNDYYHTGLVYKVDSSRVYTIEGNSSAGTAVIPNGGSVVKKSYALTESKIGGYGRPKYDSTTSTVSGSSAASQAKSSSKTLNEKKQKDGIVTAKALNVRKWAGTEYEQCSFSPLAHGQKVGICDTVYAANGDKWFYIVWAGKHGFVSAKYIV